MAGFRECLVKCSYYFLWYKIEKIINGIKVKLILLFFWGKIKLKLHCFASIDAIMVGGNWWVKADHIQLSSSSEQQSGWKIPRLAPHLIPLTLLIPSTLINSFPLQIIDRYAIPKIFRSVRPCSRTAAELRLLVPPLLGCRTWLVRVLTHEPGHVWIRNELFCWSSSATGIFRSISKSLWFENHPAWWWSDLHFRF